jgi:cell division protease FtsH
MRRKKTVILLAVILLLAAAAVGAYFYGQSIKDIEKITYVDFIQKAESGSVEVVYLSDSPSLDGQLKDGTRFVTENPRNENFKESMLVLGVRVEEGQRNSALMSALRMLLVLGMLIFAVWGISKIMNRGTTPGRKDPADKMSTMQCETVKDAGVGFDDVAGNDEAKESIKDIVDFLKNPEKYARMGARMPRGVVFYGPPGTGKTLLAKAVAGEAGAPYFAFSGSDFVQVYVGVGAARIRDVFKKAREMGKCVVFIDEIDALGKKREAALSGGNDERSQTLNALLTEMSGFNSNEGIIVIAATNRLDVLDQALLRPGRFDRQVEIGLPDINGRLEILKIHSRNKPLSQDIDLKNLAHQTVFFSGAQLENLMNEAAIFAAKRGSRLIEKGDIDKAYYTVIAGAEKKDRSAISRSDREITAYHEAGHALVTKLVAPENRVTKVTIIPSTKGAGGFSVSLPPDRMYRSRKQMESSIKIALAGRIGEEVIFGKENVTTGASNDIEKATQIVMALVKQFGMGNGTGMLNYDLLFGNSVSGQESIVEECRIFMDRFYNETLDLLVENKYLLDRIARTLLAEESIDEERLDSIIAGEWSEPHVSDREMTVEGNGEKSTAMA